MSSVIHIHLVVGHTLIYKNQVPFLTTCQISTVLMFTCQDDMYVTSQARLRPKHHEKASIIMVLLVLVRCNGHKEIAS